MSHNLKQSESIDKRRYPSHRSKEEPVTMSVQTFGIEQKEKIVSKIPYSSSKTFITAPTIRETGKKTGKRCSKSTKPFRKSSKTRNLGSQSILQSKYLKNLGPGSKVKLPNYQVTLDVNDLVKKTDLEMSTLDDKENRSMNVGQKRRK